MVIACEGDRARDAETGLQTLDSASSLARPVAALRICESPALILPNELISEIFIHFLPPYPLCSPLAGILSPTGLTQICRKWREIAQSTPRLWCAILLETSRPTTPQAHMLKSWLSRSGSCPLSIQMEMFFPGAKLVLEVIAPHRARWEHVTLSTRISDLLPMEGPLPLLRKLEMQTYGFLPPDTSFPDMPRLRVVTLWDFGYPTSLLPWFQLTSLTMIASQPHECTRVLKHAVNLVYCELILYDNEAPSPWAHNFTLPHLESLVLVDFSRDSRPAVRYLPIAPALLRLQVPERFLAEDPISTLASFISTSGCTLEELHITGELSVSPDAYHTAFPAIPKVSFNPRLKDWYCDAAEEMRRQLGTRRMTEF